MIKYGRVGFCVGFCNCRHTAHKRRKPNTRWGPRLFLGAASQIWTGDLILTKDALYRLSYSSICTWTASPLYRTRQELSRGFSEKQKYFFISLSLHISSLFLAFFNCICYAILYFTKRWPSCVNAWFYCFECCSACWSSAVTAIRTLRSKPLQLPQP